MNAFTRLWKSTDGRVGKATSCVAEYETKQNGKNVRVFESEKELEEWKLEMGNSVKILNVRWHNDEKPDGYGKAMVKSYVVRVNGADHGCWEDEKEARAYLQMLREGGTFGVLIEQTVVGQTAKGPISKDQLLQKPGESTHSEKWDRCVAHVRQSSPDADPYAVCTAMLGDESFKAMDEQEFNGLLDKALEEVIKSPAGGVGSFGITGAGPIPHSKLSRQDLEGSSTSKAFQNFSPVGGLVERIKGNQKATVVKGGKFKDVWSRVKPR